MNTNGVLLVDKAAGYSSAQVLSRIKRNLNTAEKIGHAGTLDPFATGLLIVLIGKATRLADYFQAGQKTYSGEIRLGISTFSDDITAEVLSENSEIPDFHKVEQVGKSLIGEIEQLPPRISALNIAGKRAYQLAREGQEFELNPRKVTLYSLEMHSITPNTIFFRLSCSKGFYVRAFARDLGKMLGCGACLQSLRRENSLPFGVENAHLAEDLKLTDVMPWHEAISLVVAKEMFVEDSEFSALKNGLVPYSLSRRMLSELDSDANALLVYKRLSDGVAGGLLSKVGLEFKIAVNM